MGERGNAEKANKLLSIPVTIHRPASIVGPDAPKNDILQNIFYYSKLIHAVPFSERWQGMLNIVPVETVAQAIVSNALENMGDGIWYSHICGMQTIPVQDLDKIVAELSGSQIERIEFSLWIERAKEAGMSEELAAYFSSVKEIYLRLPIIERVA